MAKRISVINFKGGVGKTTFAFNFAAGLARYHDGARVLLIDMDHQSSLSIVCLGGSRWQTAVDAAQTIDEVFKPFIGQTPTFPGPELIIRNPLRRQPYRTLALVPSSLHLDDTEIELTASHHGNPIQSEWDKRTLLCRWLEETGADNDFDYIIFDCPPATKIVAQNAVAASHGYVIPVVPEAVMERGAPHLEQIVRSGIDVRLNALASMGTDRPMFVPDTVLVALVVTRIQTAPRGSSGYTSDHTEHLASLQRRWNTRLLRPYVVQGTGVPASLARSMPVYDLSGEQNIGGREIHRQYEQLTAALKSRIDGL
ncbi:MAG: ParA family protein [Chloroflexi bacterium]|nr:ParA family protein [Chloroflexota bacterium]